MAVRVTFREIQSALNSSRKLGFGNTTLMLEGLAKQMHELEITSLYNYDLSPKIERIQKKIDCIRSTLEYEKEKEICQKEFAWKNAFVATSDIIEMLAINGIGALGLYKLLEILRIPKMEIIVGAAFAGIGLWQLSKIMKDACSGYGELVGSIKKALDSVEQFLDEAR